MEGIFATEKFFIATPESDASADEVVAAYSAVVADPGGMLYVHGVDSAEKRLQHRTLQEVQLQVVFVPHTTDRFPISVEGIPDYLPVSDYWQMGVAEPRGLMAFGVEKSRVNKINFQDPYIELIMSYFKSHLDASN
jgi:hypothetical protein